MEASSWPSAAELYDAKKKVAEMSGRDVRDVRVVISPYRICPLGAHIDHQGGIVLAMTINKGIILAFVPSSDSQVVLCSGQFSGHVKFRVDEEQFQEFLRVLKRKILIGDAMQKELFMLCKRVEIS
ncbi:Galacturonokinase [Platanthera guangdongensis]|uniref:Galacturonokinase n=1 Tax=Platanthera guangdongensis TaxID=2320717 RepID=A0ABR2LEM8_9ASPA